MYEGRVRVRLRKKKSNCYKGMKEYYSQKKALSHRHCLLKLHQGGMRGARLQSKDSFCWILRWTAREPVRLSKLRAQVKLETHRYTLWESGTRVTQRFLKRKKQLI